MSDVCLIHRYLRCVLKMDRIHPQITPITQIQEGKVSSLIVGAALRGRPCLQSRLLLKDVAINGGTATECRPYLRSRLLLKDVAINGGAATECRPYKMGICVIAVICG